VCRRRCKCPSRQCLGSWALSSPAPGRAARCDRHPGCVRPWGVASRASARPFPSCRGVRAGPAALPPAIWRRVPFPSTKSPDVALLHAGCDQRPTCFVLTWFVWVSDGGRARYLVRWIPNGQFSNFIPFQSICSACATSNREGGPPSKVTPGFFFVWGGGGGPGYYPCGSGWSRHPLPIGVSGAVSGRNRPPPASLAGGFRSSRC